MNTTTVDGVEVPTDRNSGIGREGGTWSFDFFCDVKNVATRHGSFGPGPM
jgi:acyl-CoA reductase-like NAD-dependent aldehyde dehydrogenase